VFLRQERTHKRRPSLAPNPKPMTNRMRLNSSSLCRLSLRVRLSVTEHAKWGQIHARISSKSYPGSKRPPYIAFPAATRHVSAQLRDYFGLILLPCPKIDSDVGFRLCFRALSRSLRRFWWLLRNRSTS
jgi:hypothetical protein